MDRESLDSYLAIAKEAAISAGKHLADLKKSEISIDSQVGKDVKISADIESEEIILEFLSDKTDITILSEEKGLINKGSDAARNKLRWVVDPLDGSLNYLRGIPGSCVSISLCDENNPLLGVVYNFGNDELFSGIAKVSAWRDRSRIEVSKTENASEAVLFTGFPINTDFSKSALGDFIKQIRIFKKIRLIGSAALSLSYVAEGSADAYLEKGIMLWDTAAGLAILSGAGGEFHMTKSSIPYSYDVYAANRFLLNVLR